MVAREMKAVAFLALGLIACTGATAASAPPAPMFARVAAPAEPAGAIALYEGAAPGSTAEGTREVWDTGPSGVLSVRNVTRPALTPFLPKAGTGSGAAVVVLPGGGFQMLAIDHEGWKIARWFADHGVAAFVLKYRVAPTPDDEAEMMKAMIPRMAGLMTEPEKTMAPMEPPALADALRAVAMVRDGAAKWRVDPARVGMIGFSAGAMTTRDAALAADSASRPAFAATIYGPMTAVSTPGDAPPLFTALALDDPLFGRQGFGIVESWRAAKRPVELHAYEKGGHGFGAGVPATSSSLVLPEVLAWLQGRGLLALTNAAR